MGGGGSKQKPQPSAGVRLRGDERQMLERCLYSLPFPPGTVNAGVVSEAAAITERVEYKEPVNIIMKGDRAKGIYILARGQVQVMLSTDDVVADLSPGSFFGEISTLFYVPVTATVRSTTPAQFLLVKEESLRRAVGEVVSTDLMDYYVRQRYFDTSGKLDQSELLHKIAVADVKTIPLFSKWSPTSIESLVKQSRDDLGIPYAVLLVPDKSMLVMEEDKTEEVVVVTKGKVEITREKELVATIDSEWLPIWIGEEGLFSNTDNLCAARASGTCQAFRLKKSTILNITNRYKADAGKPFAKHAEVWRSRESHQGQLSDKMKAEVLLPVLLNTLVRLEMFSSASLPYLYDVAMLCRTKSYADNGVIVDGKGNPAKVKKALQAKASQKQKNAASREPDFRVIQGSQAAAVVSENDVLLLQLTGEIVVGGVQNVIFREKSIIYLPHAQLKEIKLIAKGDTLVLTIEGSRLLNLCNTYPDVNVKIPKPVL